MDAIKDESEIKQNNVTYLEKVTDKRNEIHVELHPEVFWENYKFEKGFFEWCVRNKKKDPELRHLRKNLIQTFITCIEDFFDAVFNGLLGGDSLIHVVLGVIVGLLIPVIFIIAVIISLIRTFVIMCNGFLTRKIKDSFVYNCPLEEIETALKEGRMPKGYSAEYHYNKNIIKKISKTIKTDEDYLDIKYVKPFK